MRKLLYSLNISLVWTLTLILSLGLIYPLLEASSVLAVDQVVVTKQQVTAEISMTVASTTMVLLPAIAGLTGGTGNASTSVSVITNNKEGYYVTFRASSVGDGAMTGDSSSGYFQDYSSIQSETWSDTTSGQASQYGFGITNVVMSAGGNSAAWYSNCPNVESCWAKAPTTTPKSIVTVPSPTSATGDSFYIKFRAHIPANVNPAVPEDWYTATSTITAMTV